LFAGLSLVNGLVIELGRKIRAPGAEEVGVETYSSLYGPNRAALCWGLALTAGALLLAFMAPATIARITVACLWSVTIVTAFRFRSHPTGGRAGAIEKLSSVWVLASYVLVGAAPALICCTGVAQ
jgi:4-hydroxybenzoate polyprenyltransferase